MENKKKYGVIDLFTVFYCAVASLLALLVLGAFGVFKVNIIHMAFIIILAPYVLDLLITAIVWLCVIVYKLWLKGKKWLHEKKNPPKKF